MTAKDSEVPSREQAGAVLALTVGATALATRRLDAYERQRTEIAPPPPAAEEAETPA